ncbi:hypothetical protein [Cohnella sp. JJ-181]|uniref:hypothetical protein n=1 Tax=Cohnella rhizoplanae TaxID=2974897 RepID=UPI00232D1E69|nr:hypothetical protein [Cohnella sp. JJ-181]
MRFTLMGDFTPGLLSSLRKLGFSFAAAVPFLVAGFIVYSRIEKRKLAETRLRMQR